MPPRSDAQRNPRPPMPRRGWPYDIDPCSSKYSLNGWAPIGAERYLYPCYVCSAVVPSNRDNWLNHVYGKQHKHNLRLLNEDREYSERRRRGKTPPRRVDGGLQIPFYPPPALEPAKADVKQPASAPPPLTPPPILPESKLQSKRNTPVLPKTEPIPVLAAIIPPPPPSPRVPSPAPIPVPVPVSSSNPPPLSTATPEQVGAWLASLGRAYAPYQQAAIDNSLHGEILQMALAEPTLEAALAMLRDGGISNGVHARFILLSAGRKLK